MTKNSFTSDACLFVPEERNKYWPPGSTIVDFINGPVRAFFVWQAFKDLTGESLPERPHFIEGRIDFYAREAGLSDTSAIFEFIEFVAAAGVRRRARCYCGSGARIRDCSPDHLARVLDVRERVPAEVVGEGISDMRRKLISLSGRPLQHSKAGSA